MAQYAVVSRRAQYLPLVGFPPDKQDALVGELVAAVSRLMADGWRPADGVSVYRFEGAFSVFQAMMKD